jgi:hypothetical protein
MVTSMVRLQQQQQQQQQQQHIQTTGDSQHDAGQQLVHRRTFTLPMQPLVITKLLQAWHSSANVLQLMR